MLTSTSCCRLIIIKCQPKGGNARWNAICVSTFLGHRFGQRWVYWVIRRSSLRAACQWVCGLGFPRARNSGSGISWRPAISGPGFGAESLKAQLASKSTCRTCWHTFHVTFNYYYEPYVFDKHVNMNDSAFNHDWPATTCIDVTRFFNYSQ